MDDGYVIPGLNEGYTLAGAKIMEWVSGITMAMIAQEVMHVNIARSGPLMIFIAVVTVFGLAGARKAFPDEERGLRNCCMVAMGFAPPGIPAPAQFRDYWSGAPLRELDKLSYWEQLGLNDVIGKKSDYELGSIFLQGQEQKEAA